MGKGKRVLIVGLVGLLALTGITACQRLSGDSGSSAGAKAPATTASALADAKPAPLAKAHVFTQAELKSFLAAATSAESIADPLKRCLAYPDPPGSHWNRAAVEAYCQYRNQPIVTLAQARDLIQQGKAAELDRLLGAALQAQLTQPQARGRIDRTFFADFDDDSMDLRYLLDAWKRASPNSAFAYAASGYAYVQMAFKARGTNYINKTPQDSIDSMDRLLAQADADLQQARKLDPRITPIYTAMIQAGAYSLGADYMQQAVREGLRQDPANFTIYGQYLWAAQPQWFGSLSVMQHIVDESLKHADRNPLLLLYKPTVAAYVANIRDCCDQPVHVADFPAVFDDADEASVLSHAGNTAADHGQPGMATIYLSETVRFSVADFKDRLRLSQLIADENQPQLLMLHAQQLMAAQPENPEALALRGFAWMQRNDVPHARTDLAAALAKNPDNPAVLSLLGSIYVYSTHEWDKGWALADRLIQEYPKYPLGWRLRASIQLHQPRAGLDDTLHYFILHFSSDPQQQSIVDEMRRILAAEAKGGKDALKPFRG